MPVKKLKEFLNKHHVKYICISHSPAYTTQEIAASAHISGKQLAKTVIVKINGKLAMVVLPCNDHVNFAMLREMTGASRVDLASETEFKDKFPECELGAMPPFGNLYGMPVYLSHRLARSHQMAFNAGSHSELIRLSYDDFERLVKPKVLALEHD